MIAYNQRIATAWSSPVVTGHVERRVEDQPAEHDPPRSGTSPVAFFQSSLIARQKIENSGVSSFATKLAMA